VNHKRDRAKLLWREAAGWCLLYKRLDDTMVPALDGVDVDGAIRIDARTLASLLQGVPRPRRRRVDSNAARQKALLL
jgi:IS66 Orf2 like protein